MLDLLYKLGIESASPSVCGRALILESLDVVMEDVTYDMNNLVDWHKSISGTNKV